MSSNKPVVTTTTTPQDGDVPPTKVDETEVAEAADGCFHLLVLNVPIDHAIQLSGGNKRQDHPTTAKRELAVNLQNELTGEGALPMLLFGLKKKGMNTYGSSKAVDEAGKFTDTSTKMRKWLKTPFTLRTKTSIPQEIKLFREMLKKVTTTEGKSGIETAIAIFQTDGTGGLTAALAGKKFPPKVATHIQRVIDECAKPTPIIDI